MAGRKPRDSWLQITRSLETYVESHPERPIIVHIWASWDETGQIPRRQLQSPDVTGAFVSSGFLCLEGDATKSDPVLLEAIEMLDRKAPPVTAIYDPETGDWGVCPEVFRTEEAIEWATR